MSDARLQRFRRARRDPERTVLEGFHALKHALRFGAEVEEVVAVDPEALERLARELAPDLAGAFAADGERSPEGVARATDAGEAAPLAAERVSADELAALAPQAPRTGVLAIARRPTVDVAAALADPRPARAILLEDPRNMANMGACVRVAAAADLAAVLTTGPNDPWHPDAVRGAAGLHYALPVARVDGPPSGIFIGRSGDASAGDRPLVAIDPEGDALDPAILPPRALLAFGTERDGLGDALLARADMRVRIPMRAGVSSLNLATAVSAVIFGARLASPGAVRESPAG